MFSRRSILQAIAALPFGSLLGNAQEEPDRLAALGELYDGLEFDGQGPRYYFIKAEYAKPHFLDESVRQSYVLRSILEP